MDLSATITLRRNPDIGLNTTIKSGLRPSFNYNDGLVACEIFSADGSDSIPIGEPVAVRLHLPYADKLKWNFVPGDPFHLNAGGRVIGDGVVKEQLTPKV